ncbi:hypothetical protein [Streptomyces mirabilis]
MAAQLARELGAARVYGTIGSVEKIPYAAALGYDGVFRVKASRSGWPR